MSGRPDLNRRGIILGNDPPPTLVPNAGATPPKSAIIQAAQDASARADVITTALVHHGSIATLDIMETLRVPVTAVTNLVSFRVPQGQTAIITHVAVVCNNPAVSMVNAFAWRLLFDGQELPNLNTTIINGTKGYRTNVGNPHRPMAITPAIAQSNQLVTIELTMSGSILGNHIVFVGRLKGRIVSPGNALTLELVGM